MSWWFNRLIGSGPIRVNHKDTESTKNTPAFVPLWLIQVRAGEICRSPVERRYPWVTPASRRPDSMQFAIEMPSRQLPPTKNPGFAASTAPMAALKRP